MNYNEKYGVNCTRSYKDELLHHLIEILSSNSKSFDDAIYDHVFRFFYELMGYQKIGGIIQHTTLSRQIDENRSRPNSNHWTHRILLFDDGANNNNCDNFNKELINTSKNLLISLQDFIVRYIRDTLFEKALIDSDSVIELHYLYIGEEDLKRKPRPWIQLDVVSKQFVENHRKYTVSALNYSLNNDIDSFRITSSSSSKKSNNNYIIEVSLPNYYDGDVTETGAPVYPMERMFNILTIYNLFKDLHILIRSTNPDTGKKVAYLYDVMNCNLIGSSSNHFNLVKKLNPVITLVDGNGNIVQNDSLTRIINNDVFYDDYIDNSGERDISRFMNGMILFDSTIAKKIYEYEKKARMLVEEFNRMNGSSFYIPYHCLEIISTDSCYRNNPSGKGLDRVDLNLSWITNKKLHNNHRYYEISCTINHFYSNVHMEINYRPCYYTITYLYDSESYEYQMCAVNFHDDTGKVITVDSRVQNRETQLRDIYLKCATLFDKMVMPSIKKMIDKYDIARVILSNDDNFTLYTKAINVIVDKMKKKSKDCNSFPYHNIAIDVNSEDPVVDYVAQLRYYYNDQVNQLVHYRPVAIY